MTKHENLSNETTLVPPIHAGTYSIQDLGSFVGTYAEFTAILDLLDAYRLTETIPEEELKFFYDMVSKLKTARDKLVPTYYINVYEHSIYSTQCGEPHADIACIASYAYADIDMAFDYLLEVIDLYFQEPEAHTHRYLKGEYIASATIPSERHLSLIERNEQFYYTTIKVELGPAISSTQPVAWNWA